MDCEIIKKNAEKIISSIIEEMGYEVVEIKCEIVHKQIHLTIYVFSQSGISIQDCVDIDAKISNSLEEANISNGESYVLNVSSPGLDRLIFSNDDYRRNTGVKVELIKNNHVNKKDLIIGYIREFDDASVTIETDKGKTVKVERSNIKTLLPYINFK